MLHPSINACMKANYGCLNDTELLMLEWAQRDEKCEYTKRIVSG